MEIRVILLKPGHRAEIVNVENNLKALQSQVGGYIEVIKDASESRNFDFLLILNEEGKLLGQTPNLKLGSDILVGNIVICGVDGEEFSSLSPKQAELLCKAYDYKRGLLK